MIFFLRSQNNILQYSRVAGRNMGASSGHHLMSLHRKVGGVFQRTRQFTNLLIKTTSLKHSKGKHPYLGIWQHSKYFCSIFQGVLPS